MNVYYCNSFTGHYPVGSVAIVLASSATEARELLAAELEKRGLSLRPADGVFLLTKSGGPRALILHDGDY